MARKAQHPTANTSRRAAPMPIGAEEDDNQQPIVLNLMGDKLAVISVDDWWEDEEDWWKDDPVVRKYYQVTTDGGHHLTIFRNVVHGGWYCQEAQHP